jgi:cellulose biosynthesis protein BcsQ
MKICVFTLKGGVGKTTLSALICLAHKFQLVTNDRHTPYEAFPAGRVVQLGAYEDLPTGENLAEDVVFDFGGFADPRLIDALKISDALVIPTLTSFQDLRLAIATENELKPIAPPKIKKLIVINRVRTDQEGEEAQLYLEEHTLTPSAILRQSKVAERVLREAPDLSVMREGKSSMDRFDRYVYRNFLKGFATIEQHLDLA